MNALIINTHTNATQQLAGMTITERVSLSAAHWGAKEIVTVATEQDLAQALEQLRDAGDGVLILWGHVVYDKGLIADQLPGAQEIAQLTTQQRSYPVVWVGQQHLDAVLTPQQIAPLLIEQTSVQQAVDAWAQACANDRWDMAPPSVVIEVLDAASAKDAQDALWASCRKPIDGLVSTHINRHVSLFISRRLVNTGITPNHISVFCLLLGIGSGVAVAMNTTTSLIVGAILLKLNSIIDGVDGELARVKWAYSKFGEWLDAAGDNVTNFSFFGALTYVMWLNEQTTYAIFGTVCLGMWLTHLSFVYAQLYKMKRGDVLLVRQHLDDVNNGWLPRIIDVLRYKVLRRDFFVMLAFVMVLLGQAGPLLVIMCFGASIAFFGVLAHGVMSLARALRPKPATT